MLTQDEEKSRLAELLASQEPYPRKVEAIIAAVRGGDSTAFPTVRRYMPQETDPFVLATMASALGHGGRADDHRFLVPLLTHSDQRVVANTLEALYRLKIQVPREELLGLIESSDNRVRMNALAVLAMGDPAGALERLRAMAGSENPAARAAVAFLLGELPNPQAATELLISMVEVEENTAVLKQIAIGLKKIGLKTDTVQLVGRLYVKRQWSSGAKRSVLDMFLHAIAKESGMPLQKIQEIGETYAKQMFAAPAPETTVRRPRKTLRMVAKEAIAGLTGTVRKTLKETPSLKFQAIKDADPPVTPDPEPPPAAAPPAEVVEEDEEMSFTAVWGPTTQAISVQAIQAAQAAQAAGASPSTSATSQTVAISTQSISRKISRSKAVQIDEPPASKGFPAPARWILVCSGAFAMLLGVISFHLDAAKPSPEGEPGITRKTRPGRLAHDAAPTDALKVTGLPPAGTANAGEEAKLEKYLGPSGASVKLTGTLVGVSFGRPIVTYKGRHYMVVRGKVPDELRQGEDFQLSGKILGSSEAGIFYVEVGS